LIMKAQRAPFLPVTSDIDDAQLERLAKDKGVGSLVKPMPNNSRAGEGAPMPPDPSTVEDEAPTSAATPRSRMKTVNLELPDYVWTDLKMRAAHKQTSVRHIVMTALKREGITIADIDMVEDGRRMRGSNRAD
jgi:hypothetical protein